MILHCPKCSRENPEENRFCGGCGYQLEANQPGDERAGADHRASSSGERRQVTILFSDLTGYTSMAEWLDPEEVQKIMRRILAKITQIMAFKDYPINGCASWL